MIPFKGLGNVAGGSIQLLPGNNLVDDNKWNVARKSVEAEIGKSIIEVASKLVEVQEEVEEMDEKTKKVTLKKVKKMVSKSKSLNELDANEASLIVEDTYSLDTLYKWKDGESRDSVRATILKQIEAVETSGKQGKK